MDQFLIHADELKMIHALSNAQLVTLINAKNVMHGMFHVRIVEKRMEHAQIQLLQMSANVCHWIGVVKSDVGGINMEFM